LLRRAYLFLGLIEASLAMLFQPYGLLWLGVVLELLLTASLVLVPSLGSIVAMGSLPLSALAGGSGLRS
jgi:hypothetical protein